MAFQRLDLNNLTKAFNYKTSIKFCPDKDTNASTPSHISQLPKDATIRRTLIQKQKRHFEQDEIAQMITDYTEHKMTVYQLAEKYGCHRTTISKRLKENGVEVSVKRLNSQQVKDIAKLYQTGLTAEHIAKSYNVDTSTILRTLRNAGVTMRKRHNH